MTAHTFCAHQLGTARLVVEDDGLMSAVVARYLTASATETLLLVELGIDDGGAVQIVWVEELRYLLAYQCLQVADAALGHIATESEDKVFDDTITILHDSGTNLYVAAAELDKFQRIAPCFNTTDAADNGSWLYFCQLQDIAEGDGSDGPSGITRYGAMSRYLCISIHRYRLDGVDG